MKPILFNTEMVRAFRAGQKTQTRRVVKPQPQSYSFDGRAYIFDEGELPKPQYQPGDILYVRETWSELKYPDGSRRYVYKASDEYPFGEAGYIVKFRWRPSIHMPKEAARIFLRVTDVRVERLQDITIDDAIAEGCNEVIPITEFRLIWIKTIKPADRERYGWNANPWVWVYTFERIRKEDAE